MILTLQGVTYTHPNKDILFSDINLAIGRYDKAALIGNNGTGKSTLLKLLAGKLQPSAGGVRVESKPYYVPQVFGQFNHLTVAEALDIANKLTALQQILDGQANDANLTLLADDWTIEERCREALDYWQLNGVELTQSMAGLSGGQKTKVFLAGIIIHQPEIVLLDEPSNHLDASGRNLLYNYIANTRHTLVVVSHDRVLLNQLNVIYELSKRGITTYGGNYDFYAEQKAIVGEALNNDIRSKEKALRKARDTERDTMERQQKLDARGKRKQEKAGVPTIMMNTLRNNAERSTARIKGMHADKMDGISRQLTELRKEQAGTEQMKMDFDNSALHRGKVLVTAQDVNVQFGGRWLWEQPLNLQLISGERVLIKGMNGSGKTTLINLILGKLVPQAGSINRANINAVYIDQDYSLIDDRLTVYEQAQAYNSGVLQEHEIRIRLNRFLFGPADWDKPCQALSGGERMRLMLCSLAIANQSPDVMILDEPTNNLDIQNIEILTAAVNEYQGTLLVVTHDERFAEQINLERVIEL